MSYFVSFSSFHWLGDCSVMYQMGFQDPGIIIIEGIYVFNLYLSFVIISIVLFAAWLLFITLKNFSKVGSNNVYSLLNTLKKLLEWLKKKNKEIFKVLPKIVCYIKQASQIMFNSILIYGYIFVIVTADLIINWSKVIQYLSYKDFFSLIIAKGAFFQYFILGITIAIIVNLVAYTEIGFEITAKEWNKWFNILEIILFSVIPIIFLEYFLVFPYEIFRW